LSSFSLLKANEPSILDKNKSDSVDVIDEAKVNYEKALTLHNAGKYILAESAFLEASEEAEKVNEIKLLAYSYHYLGRIENWKSNYSKSIYYHKKAHKLFKELKNSKYRAISNNQISFAFESLAQYDSAAIYYKRNIEQRENVDFKYTILLSYQRLAGLYSTLNNYKQAYRFLVEGIAYAEETESKLSLAELYYTTGRLFLKSHVNTEIALEYFQEAKNIFAELNNLNFTNLVHLSIADVHLATGNDSLALLNYRKVANSIHESHYASLSQANHKLGMFFKDKNQLDSALIYLQKSIDVMCTVCPEISIHNTLIEASGVYFKNGNDSEAYKYLKRAKKIATESNSGFEMAETYKKLAFYFEAIQKPDSAKHYYLLSHSLAKELGLPKMIKETAESLSNIYYSQHAFQTSSDYLKLADQMNDTLASIEKYKEIAQLEMRFEIEKNEQERKLETNILQSEISKQKLIRNTSIAGTLFLIFIGLLLLKAYRTKKKDNKLLAKQKKEIQDISTQLQESGKRKLDFFTNISHEIRTPLTLIKSPLERILKSDIYGDAIGNQLQIALNNTNKLNRLVNQILDLQKLDEHQLDLDLSEFEIIAFCTEIVSSFEGYCYQSNCSFTFEANIGKALVKFDQGRLLSIMNNLLSNAFKFNKENGLVKFNVDVKDKQLKFKITDTGKGISKEHLEHLGKRYYQFEKPDSGIEGTGIGLAYVKELVDLMKGKIEISSTVNKGTTVSISLPCHEMEILDKKPVKIEKKPDKQIFDQIEKEISDKTENDQVRILIVEDNTELRLFLRDLFSPSFHVVCAKDGQEGMDLALKHLPEIIISDVMMPGIRGNELCKLLKHNISTSHITIILFTAKGTHESIVDGYDCGADDYIVKPFDTDLLVKKVKNIVTTGENNRKQFSFTDIEHTNHIYSEYDKKFLQDCMTIVKDNMSKCNFTVESLADHLNIHRRTLLRKFKALTGKLPIDLIKHARMTHAANLIRSQKYRVNEVAFMVGYEDNNRFSQAFKQFHGQSPSTYNSKN
jgi:signal transduction histidine kinase/AraC-like DNA-binding protein